MTDQHKVFTSTGFEGHWPVGTSAVIVATTIEGAVELLSDAVALHGLKQQITADMLVEVDLASPAAIVLQDGDY